MDKGTIETIQEYYAPGGIEDNWKEMQEKTDPNIAEKYFLLLSDIEIIPKTKEQLEQYVFYSPTANQRFLEFGFAEKLEELCSGFDMKSKPKIICSDAFGTEKLAIDRTSDEHRIIEYFKPGFVGDTPVFNNVDIVTVSAKANEIPLADNSVDVVWDRLGAMWHYLEYAQTNRKTVNNTVKELLDEYGRILKRGGKVIFDAGEVRAASVSTYALAIKGKEKVDFESLGWHVELAGQDSYEVAILSKI
jgi:hypothetical protein